MDAMTLVAKLILDKSEFENGLQDAERSATGGNSGLTKWGVAAGQVAANAFSAGFKTLSRFTKDAILNSMSFDATMSEVKAVGQMTDEQFNAVRDTAIELGRTTKFTAQEAAQGLYYMAIAGWDAEKMMKGIPSVLNLAAASGEDLGTTSDIVTDAMEAFGIGADRTANFVDVLAAAASNSNTTVGMMGEAFKYVGPYAGILGYSINDVAIGMGLLANQGIKSSQAGTTLRQVFSSLVRPSVEGAEAMEDYGISLEDANGRIKSFKELMTDLRTVFKNSGFDVAGGQLDEFRRAAEELEEAYESGRISLDEYTEGKKEILVDKGPSNVGFLSQMADIFGVRGLTGVLAIMKASEDSWDKLSESIENSEGMADLMSETMLDNLKGDITLMQSALQGLQQLIMDSGFTEGLRSFIQDITTELGELAKTFNEGGLAGMFNNLSQWLIDGITETLTSADFAEGAGQFGQALGDFVGHLVNTLVASAPEIMSGLFEAGMNLAGGLVEGLFSGLFGTQEGSMKYFMDKTQDEQKKAIDEANKTATQAQGIVGYMDSLVQKYGEAAKSTEEWASAMKNLQDLMPDVSDAMSKPVESLGEMVGNLRDYVEQMRQLAVQQAQEDSLKAYRDKYAQALIDQAQNQYNYEQAQSQMDVTRDTLYRLSQTARDVMEANQSTANKYSAMQEMLYYNGLNRDSDYFDLSKAHSQIAMRDLLGFLTELGLNEGFSYDGIKKAFDKAEQTASDSASQMEKLAEDTEALGQELKIAEQAVATMTESGEETGLFGQENGFGQTESGTVDTSSLQGAVDSAASEIEGIDADLNTSSLQSSADSAASSVAAMGDSAASADVSGYQAGLDSAGSALSSMAASASIDTSGLQSAIAAAASALSGLASSASAVDFSGLSFGAIGGMTGPAPTINIPARHAKGAWDIPYDDYPALLHRGEMVLTASQARRYRAGSGDGIDPSLLYQAVASAVESAVAQIQINMDSMLVGNAVTKQVSKNIYREQYGRRYATI